MSESIPDLWPAYVSQTDLLLPVTILRYQAAQLRKKTKNLLEAEVVPIQAAFPTEEAYYFELIAPILDYYHYRIFAVSYDREQVYPVFLYAPPEGYSPTENKSPSARAETQEAFLAEVSKILDDRKVKSVIQSLLARSNDSVAKTQSPPPEGGSG
jgi:hypothetical protein